MKLETVKQDKPLPGQAYAYKVSDHVKGAMMSSDPVTDPVARQYIPLSDEDLSYVYEQTDPIGDEAYSPVKGIVHRYPDRVLYKITNICPVYCRYCFRKAMVGPGSQTLKKSQRHAALDYIRNTPQIWEVILTGGDPLILSPAQLQETFAALAGVNHLKVIRIHTRTPIASPDLITDTMIEALQNAAKNKALYMALHVNHAQEITPQVQQTLNKLRRAGVILLSQSVLLKGVNDNTDALEQLFRTLVELSVKPYMIHHLDPAPGTHHFRVSIETGKNLLNALRGQISGICMPDYMLDIPGGFGKIVLNADNCKKLSSGNYELTDRKGQKHHYIDWGE